MARDLGVSTNATSKDSVLAQRIPVRMMTCANTPPKGAYGVRTGSLPRTFSVTHLGDDLLHGSDYVGDRAEPGTRRVPARVPVQSPLAGKNGGDDSSPPQGPVPPGEVHGGADSAPPSRRCGAGAPPRNLPAPRICGIPRWCGLHTTVGPACSLFSRPERALRVPRGLARAPGCGIAYRRDVGARGRPPLLA